jgi:hypothetical protein
MSRLISIRVFPACLIAVVLASAAVRAEVTCWDLPFSDDLRDAGWRLHTPRGKQPAEFSVADGDVLSVSAQSAVSFLYREVPKAARDASGLSWTWRVDQDIPPTDLSTPGADDRPFAVHVYFDDRDAGLLRRFAGLFGLPAGGRALTYVWGGDRPQGTMIANPFMANGQGALVVVRPSSLDDIGPDWETVRVDLAGDYRRIFNREPVPLRGIAISSDTDDTATSARGRIKNVFLTSDSAAISGSGSDRRH